MSVDEIPGGHYLREHMAEIFGPLAEDQVRAVDLVIRLSYVSGYVRAASDAARMDLAAPMARTLTDTLKADLLKGTE